ncbi:MAG: hypothetical protein ABEL76_03210 [Bradymonadaceae bacterium]
MSDNYSDILQRIEMRGEPWNATEDLKEILSEADPDLVERALDSTAQAMDDELAEMHVEIAVDASRSPQTRSRAAIALGPALETCDMGSWETNWDPPPLSEDCYREVKSALDELVRDEEAPKLVRRRAFEAAVRSPEDWHREFVDDIRDADDADWRLTAVFAARRLGMSEVVMDGFSDPDERIVREACEGLSHFHPEGSVDACKRIAQDASLETETRISALWGLAATGADGLYGFFEDLKFDARDADIRNAADEALDEWNQQNRMRREAEELGDLPEL